MSSKTLTFYTSLSSATKRLRSPIQIVLTLSLDPLRPVVRRSTKEPHAKETVESQLPIAWQVLQFDLPSSSQSLSVDYGEAFAAMEVESTINGVYQPGRSSSPEVETGKLVKYTGRVWSVDTLYTPGPPLGYFAIQSDAAKPVEMILGCEFHCTKPVYLQAYTTLNHRRGQRLAHSVVEEMFLFRDSTGKPKAKLLVDLKGARPNKCAFQVYSHHNGEIALEMTVNQD
ncbi:hypothetical protein B0H16DRAFT_1638622 [Mycena metata]|uniref:Uncharacterized protein n=1 Tax=Mycena metata TaxID=1033252 RepID=A0AAD7M6M0_9AGAR|nr:hypothetical protein B0H16DRAFT_1638622 [Mycena metata]